MSDPIADMLTRIRNAHSASKLEVSMPASKIKKAIAAVLLDEGYIESFNTDSDGKPTLNIILKYFKGTAVIESIHRVSRPGLRVYKKSNDIPKVQGGLGISIVSTSNGMMSDIAARKNGLGGEIVCSVS